MGNAGKYPTHSVEYLIAQLRELLKLCFDGLALNKTLIGPDQVSFHTQLEQGYRELHREILKYIDVALYTDWVMFYEEQEKAKAQAEEAKQKQIDSLAQTLASITPLQVPALSLTGIVDSGQQLNNSGNNNNNTLNNGSESNRSTGQYTSDSDDSNDENGSLSPRKRSASKKEKKEKKTRERSGSKVINNYLLVLFIFLQSNRKSKNTLDFGSETSRRKQSKSKQTDELFDV